MPRRPNLSRPRPGIRSSGVSLLELLLSLTLLLLISAIAFAFYARFSQRYGVEMESANLTSAANNGLSTVLAGVRMAGYPAAALALYGPGATANNSNLVAAGFSAISGGAMTFTAALGNTGAAGADGAVYQVSGQSLIAPVVDQVQFQLAEMPRDQVSGCAANPQYPTATLWQLTRAVAPEDTSGAAGSAATLVVVNNIFSPTAAEPAIFNYFDGDGIATTDPASVAEVQVAFTLQTCQADRKDHLPLQMPFSGIAYVRNNGQ